MSVIDEISTQTITIIALVYFLIQFIFIQMVLGFNKLVSKIFKKKNPLKKKEFVGTISSLSKKENNTLGGTPSLFTDGSKNTSFLPPREIIKEEFKDEEDYLDLTKKEEVKMGKCEGCGIEVKEGYSACNKCIKKILSKYSNGIKKPKRKK